MKLLPSSTLDLGSVNVKATLSFESRIVAAVVAIQ